MLFVVAWALVTFGVVRGLMIAWSADRVRSSAAAVAVACAFVLGALTVRGLSAVRDAPPPSAAAAADTSKQVDCPAGLAVAPTTAIGEHGAPGNIDGVAAGSAAPGPAAPLRIPAGTVVRLVGWGGLPTGPSNAICAVVDGKAVPGPARYFGMRSDVATAVHNRDFAESGFDVPVRLGPGVHEVTVGFVTIDGHAVEPLKQSVRVTVH